MRQAQHVRNKLAQAILGGVYVGLVIKRGRGKRAHKAVQSGKMHGGGGNVKQRLQAVSGISHAPNILHESWDQQKRKKGKESLPKGKQQLHCFFVFHGVLLSRLLLSVVSVYHRNFEIASAKMGGFGWWRAFYGRGCPKTLFARVFSVFVDGREYFLVFCAIPFKNTRGLSNLASFSSCFLFQLRPSRFVFFLLLFPEISIDQQHNGNIDCLAQKETYKESEAIAKGQNVMAMDGGVMSDPF
jgi:hypothetical protein